MIDTHHLPRRSKTFNILQTPGAAGRSVGGGTDVTWPRWEGSTNLEKLDGLLGGHRLCAAQLLQLMPRSGQHELGSPFGA